MAGIAKNTEAMYVTIPPHLFWMKSSTALVDSMPELVAFEAIKLPIADSTAVPDMIHTALNNLAL